MGSSAVLTLPAYKVVLAQLQSAQKRKEDSILTYAEWDIQICGKTPLKMSNIWIQGHVIPLPPDISEAENDVLLVDDGTGICLVTGLSRIPISKEGGRLAPGDRVLVIGYVLNAGDGMGEDRIKYLEERLYGKVKAIKITEVSSNINCSVGKEWQSEVFQTQMAVLESTT